MSPRPWIWHGIGRTGFYRAPKSDFNPFSPDPSVGLRVSYMAVRGGKWVDGAYHNWLTTLLALLFRKTSG